MTEAVIDPLTQIIDRIKKAIDPEKIILFGSRASNSYSEESDYDIFVILDGDYNKRMIKALSKCSALIERYKQSQEIPKITEIKTRYMKNGI